MGLEHTHRPPKPVERVTEAPARSSGPTCKDRFADEALRTPAQLLGVQRALGNAAVVNLLARQGQPPVIRRAYWEKTAQGEYVWHGGEEMPPKGYVKLDEPQRQHQNPKNKRLYDIWAAPSKSKKKKKGAGAKTPEVSPPKVTTPPPVKAKPLNKQQATTAAAQAPALMERAEAEALSAATEMERAIAPDVAVAAAKAAEDAAGRSKASEVQLSDLLGKVGGFGDIAAEVRVYVSCAVAAAAAAAKFAAQAKRLAAVAEAQVRARQVADQVGAEVAKLETARKRDAELTQEIEYLEAYYPVLRQAALAVRDRTFEKEDPAEVQAQVLAGIVAASRERGETIKEIEDLEVSVAALKNERDLAVADVPLKTEAAKVGGAGLSDSKADLEGRRALRDLAGGEVSLSELLALPKFSGSQSTLKPYLQAVGAGGLKKPQVVKLIAQLSDSRTEAELGTLAKAVVDGADCDVAILLAKADPPVSATQVSLFANVQATASCKARVVVDLLPVRAVAAYATEPILVELAQLAAGGKSAARMAQIIVAEPALPKGELVGLTALFDKYPAADEILLLATMLREGMKGGRKAANLAELINDLEGRGTGIPAATIVKTVLQSAGLASFTITELGQLMTSLNGLNGQQMAQTSTWLAPLTAADRLALIDVFVTDATPVIAIHETFQILNKAKLNGGAIRDKVYFLRGYLVAPGGDADASVTEVGGKKILTGPEIHAHALNALAGAKPETKVAELNNYPKGENPRTRSVDNLWLDANPTPRGAETAEEAVRRRKLAIAEICALAGYIPHIVQQMVAHDNGATPRAVGLPAAEDALDPSAHTNDKHVIGGGGSVNTWRQLAGRACYSPTAKGQATAFKSPALAQQAIQAALDSYIAAGNWSTLRRRLCMGDAVAIEEPVATDSCFWLRTIAGPNNGPNGLYDRNGDGTYLNQAARPRYDGGSGGRRWFDGDNGAVFSSGGYLKVSGANNAAFVTFGNGPDNKVPKEAACLTESVAVTGIHVRLVAKNVDGGFYVNSAYSY